MSRVDEARRRVERRDAAHHAPLEARRDLAIEPDQSVLENYPRERRPAERPTPVPPPRAISAPRAASSRPLRALDAALDGKLVGGRETPPMAVEQYRRLASSLHQLQTEVGLKTLMVTSALPREGKTLTVTNLALTLSESYRKRVLLIDADLRRPSLHEVFGLPKTSGLSEALRSGIGPHMLELSQLLSILPAGEPEADPLGALTSDRMGALLEECAAAFDWVLLDAPPVGLMPDGNVLARLTKAVVFVIAAGSTPYKLIERAVAEVGREHIVGTVLNRVDEQQLPVAAEYSEYYASAASSELA